jgi:uncharacterized UPF0160 family protein
LIVDYVHQPLDQEIIAIGGHYITTEEVRVPFEGREILYLKGYAVMDTSCCGLKGCAFVHVKGFVVDWKVRTNPEGLEMTQVEPITDERMRERIRKLLQSKEVFHQIQFD